MTVRRLDNISIVVQNLPAAIAFFTELGLKLEGQMPIEGGWVDRIIGLRDVRTEIAMLRTPDGSSGVELAKFHNPKPITTQPGLASPHTLGIGRVMFAVDDLDDTLARLHTKHGAQLIGEVVQYEDAYRLCYLRGPEGIIIALAQELG